MLDEKIKIMSLLDLIFKLPKNNRSVTFDAIAHRCELSFNDVEILIMRCMSLELIRGYIDQVSQNFPQIVCSVIICENLLLLKKRNKV